MGSQAHIVYIRSGSCAWHRDRAVCKIISCKGFHKGYIDSSSNHMWKLFVELALLKSQSVNVPPKGSFADWPNMNKDPSAASGSKILVATADGCATQERVVPVKRKLTPIEIAWGKARGYGSGTAAGGRRNGYCFGWCCLLEWWWLWILEWFGWGFAKLE